MTPSHLRTLPDSTIAAMVRNTTDGNIRRIIGIRRPEHPGKAKANQWAISQAGYWRPYQFAAVAGVTRQTANEWLSEMVDAGQVVRVGYGLYESKVASQ